ncbi:hypothetical protein [Scytonema sp. UIC 10036]|uniref:hypothetical protein n=1 Tax=Scytonema sp. UIC 10036 TaxID=2304196 RepID=UPI001FAA2CF6|nr:hypothetical protein [Scytonema sp. UIC 10036]
MIKLTESKEFQQVIPLSDAKRKRMDDREFVLGFLAFYLTSYKDYKDSTRDSFLSKALSKANNLLDEEMEKIEHKFKNVMIIALEIFGKDSFRKISNKNKKKYPINKSLFEVWSLNLCELNDDKIEIF